MAILTISGSTSLNSSNTRLMRALPDHFENRKFIMAQDLGLMPLFRADADHAPYARKILEWRKSVSLSVAVIISTPAYLSNIPAALKNAL